MAVLLLSLFLAFLTPRSSSGTADSIRVTYVGNEGFLLEGNGKKVLIDALYRAGVSGYAVHPPDLRKSLERALPPFDDVDLVLVTHFHADHFDPDAVGVHLLSNRKALLITTKQAAAQMEGYAGYRNIQARIRGVFPQEGHEEIIEHDGIRVHALNLHHGRDRPVENLGFVIDLGDRRFLHIGDSEATAAEIGVYETSRDSIDFFFVPYWSVLSPSEAGDIVAAVGPKVVIPMHIPPRDDPRGYLSNTGGFEQTLRRIESNYPNVVVFADPMATRTFP